jgi:hypothetical protein
MAALQSAIALLRLALRHLAKLQESPVRTDSGHAKAGSESCEEMLLRYVGATQNFCEVTIVQMIGKIESDLGDPRPFGNDAQPYHDISRECYISKILDYLLISVQAVHEFGPSLPHGPFTHKEFQTELNLACPIFHEILHCRLL